jgi:hypothetical protein
MASLAEIAKSKPEALHIMQDVFEVVDFKRVEKYAISQLRMENPLGIRVTLARVWIARVIISEHVPDLSNVFLSFAEAKEHIVRHLRSHLADVERLDQSA